MFTLKYKQRYYFRNFYFLMNSIITFLKIECKLKNSDRTWGDEFKVHFG